MHQEPLISILLPVKNTEAYLPDCLNSILSQRFSNWELLAVNDHSTDNSKAILSTYARQDYRISVLDNEGTGIINALRLAYNKSKGAYITRMDSDDRMVVDKLEVLLTNVHENGVGTLAVGQVKYFSDTPLGNGYQQYEQWLNQLTEKGDNYQEIYKECVIPSPCWMVHRQDLDRCGAFQPNRYPEDYDLCFRFYQQGLKVIPCQQVLHYWRDYPTRTSRTDDNYADNRFLDLKLDYFLELDYTVAQPLVLWGAGKKGKWLAKKLVEQDIAFHWVCNNPQKIGKSIYGCLLKDTTTIHELILPQYIIAVANKEEQEAIKKELEGQNYFFFC